MDKVHFISSEEGDWVGVYVGSDLLMEGHSINPKELLKELGFSVTSEEKPVEWFEEHGYQCAPTLESK